MLEVVLECVAKLALKVEPARKWGPEQDAGLDSGSAAAAGARLDSGAKVGAGLH